MLYNLKIIRSGKRVEIYKMSNYVINKSNKSNNPTGRKGKDTSEEDEEVEKKDRSHESRLNVLNKARNNIIRLISANPDMTTFITLTFREESDFIESKRYLNNLFTKLRNNFNNLKYLWVLEYGNKNQRLHYHLLCNMPVYIKLSSNKEYKNEEHKKYEQAFAKKYWKYGFVDIRRLDSEGVTNIGLYVSVYITKSMENKELEGYRIYGYSNKTLKKPTEELSYTRDTLEEILREYSTEYDVRYSSKYKIGFEDYCHKKGIVNYLDLYEK